MAALGVSVPLDNSVAVNPGLAPAPAAPQQTLRELSGPEIERPVVRAKPTLYFSGPNYAADAIVLRDNPTNQKTEVLLIQRRSGKWAVPGGFIDLAEQPERQEAPLTAALRELGEEAITLSDDLTDSLRARAKLLYSGVVKDPRNHFQPKEIGGVEFPPRWIESKAYIFKVGYQESEQFKLASQDPNEIKGRRWLDVNSPEIQELYADHPSFIRKATKFCTQELTRDHEPMLADLSALRDLGYKRIAILGGTFDPPQLGHLRAAEVILKQDKADCVVFMPAGQNPLKLQRPTADGWQRAEMLRAMCLDNPRLFVSPAEVFNSELCKQPSFTVQTLTRVKKELNLEQEILLVLGSDVLQTFNRFKQPEEILKLAKVMALPRPGIELAAIPTFAEAITPDPLLINVSATQVRQALKDNPAEASKYVHPNVKDYIVKNVAKYF